MFYYTYMLKSISPGYKKLTLVIQIILELRLNKHNSNNGAKSTKGYKWILIYSKKFKIKRKLCHLSINLKIIKFKKRIIRKISIMKISILLPYKENFSSEYAGAVSIFINDTVLKSKYKNTTHVYGNTDFKKDLLKNYINLSLDKKSLLSSSNFYVNNFIKKRKVINSDIIEIHNRPNYIKKF